VTALYVVPCGAGKLDQPAFARDLYTSAHFRFVLTAARAAAGSDDLVRILSARHGLIPLALFLQPYDVTMRDADSISAARIAHQLQLLVGELDVDQVHALLPRAYLTRLQDAVELVHQPPYWIGSRTVELVDHYAGARGIGDQRRAASQLGVAAAGVAL